MPNYSVVIAVNDCHSQKLGVHSWGICSETPKQAAITVINSTWVFEEFISKWVDRCANSGLAISEDDVLNELSQYAMVSVFGEFTESEIPESFWIVKKQNLLR